MSVRKKTERESPTPAPCTTPQDGQARHRQQRLWPNSSHSPQQAAQAGGTSSTRGQGGHRPRHDTVHVRPHRAHITWLDHAHTTHTTTGVAAPAQQQAASAVGGKRHLPTDSSPPTPWDTTSSYPGGPPSRPSFWPQPQQPQGKNGALHLLPGFSR